MAHKINRALLEDNCIHLLKCVSRCECPPPQTYEGMAKQTGIPKRTLWDIVNKYRDILRATAERYNYRVRFLHSNDRIIDVVYDGPVKDTD